MKTNTLKTQMMISYVELQGLSAQNEEIVLPRLMDLIHESGGVIDRMGGNGFTIYWSSSVESYDAVRNSVRAMSRIQDAVAELNRKLAKRRIPSSFRLKAAMAYQEISGEVAVQFSVASRTLAASKVRIAIELCAQNGFLGTDLLMDRECAEKIGRWHPTELAGRVRMRNSAGGQPMPLFRFPSLMAVPDYPNVSRREKSGEIVISPSVDQLEGQLEDVVVSMLR